MNDSCLTCKFYVPARHRGQRYMKGQCQRHAARRISDGYVSLMTVTAPAEYICDDHAPAPRPVYAVVGGEPYLVPPAVVIALQREGWYIVPAPDFDTLREGEGTDGK